MAKRTLTGSVSDPRLLALRVLQRVVGSSESLATAVPAEFNHVPEHTVRAQAQAFCYGVLRWYFRLQSLSVLLLQRPLRTKDLDIQLLLLMGLYQLNDARKPEYAVVSATVETVAMLGKPWAKGLLNGVLRRFIRERDELEQSLQSNLPAQYAAPDWMIRRLQNDWPAHWQELLLAANQQPPMFLRVDTVVTQREHYLQQLRQQGIEAEAVGPVATAIRLFEPREVMALPGFDHGLVSVQDAAAQCAAAILDPRAGERVLDACAAPGGKTLHLLQQQPALRELLAIDIDAQRLQRVRENLQRAGLTCDSHNHPSGSGNVTLKAADIAQPEQWWDGQAFDRILLDAPCTASGVIRRHPDIKLLRREADIESLVLQQRRILSKVWPTLKPGGYLLYATCSVFKDENERQIAGFLQTAQDARPVELHLPAAIDCSFGVQFLSGREGMDGFFYALLQKAE